MPFQPFLRFYRKYVAIVLLKYGADVFQPFLRFYDHLLENIGFRGKKFQPFLRFYFAYGVLVSREPECVSTLLEILQFLGDMLKPAGISNRVSTLLEILQFSAGGQSSDV